MDAQLKKGVLELCLLKSIGSEAQYGYDVIQKMHEFFPEVTESTFYAILRRLGKEGAAETYQGSVSNGPVRKYYRLTDEGRERLAQMTSDWKRLREIMVRIGVDS